MKNEIAFKDVNAGMKVAEMLLNEDYVVLLSREDSFLVINFEFSDGADRNNVVFMSYEEYEAELDKCGTEVYEDIRHDIRSGFIKNLSDI